ncbi:AraC family transcriptional regulator [Paenibacillus arenosi]|uniref:AraC family transcriptional regulator n=1 Tax=Paenibacillus arenosi TaxID=2774142 RepID=A0ABR9B4G9_9BACL|nr:AraC family transcriptional regulator [Paenibacillus arenosi]MBD8501255.1 AraC family transcriptional regulator [Paenibacillus arenosi]
MNWVESLQMAIEYMEDHLLDDISIEQIAKYAHSSPFHFQRTFSILTDMTVGDYLRRRRLTLAAQELATSNSKVIDIALKYGYETPEAFAKAFRKQHNLSPSNVRQHIGKLKSYNRLIIQMNLKGVEPMNYRIVERGSFKVVGQKREISMQSNVNGNMSAIPQFWNDAHVDGTNDLLFKLNNGEIKGVLGVCVDKESKGRDLSIIDYWIGTDYIGETPQQLLELEIPPSKWVIFEVHGAMPEAMQNTWKKIMSEWFPSNSYQHAEIPDLEVYSEGNPNSSDYYSEIWIPIM